MEEMRHRMAAVEQLYHYHLSPNSRPRNRRDVQSSLHTYSSITIGRESLSLQGCMATHSGTHNLTTKPAALLPRNLHLRVLPAFSQIQSHIVDRILQAAVRIRQNRQPFLLRLKRGGARSSRTQDRSCSFCSRGDK